jgi:hypothetical protein
MIGDDGEDRNSAQAIDVKSIPLGQSSSFGGRWVVWVGFVQRVIRMRCVVIVKLDPLRRYGRGVTIRMFPDTRTQAVSRVDL